MHEADYDILAEAVRFAAAGAEGETHPGGLLAGLSAEQVRRVAVVIVSGMTDHLAGEIHTFNRDLWLNACAMDGEVAALRSPVSVRAPGAPVDFDAVRVGDWIQYENRPGQPVIGRVRTRTKLVVRTEDEHSLVSDVVWPQGHELRRSRWGRLHVALAYPGAVWWADASVWADTLGVEEPVVSVRASRRPPRAKVPASRRVPRDQVWPCALEAARAYLARHGHLRVPAKHMEDGYRLGAFLSDQRCSYRRGVINPERVRDLDALHVSWRDGCEPDARR